MSRTFLLQDWVTLRGTNTTLQTFTQDEERWLDLAGYSDATCWIDVTEVTPPAGLNTNSLSLTLETAAVCDDTYFTPMATVSYGTAGPFTQASTTPIVVRSTRSISAAALMRYVRWKITPSTTGLWDISFRVRVVATRSNAFVPTDIAGCTLWLRSDLGVTANASTSAITLWKDQSGNGFDAAPGTSPTYAPASANATGLPSVHVVGASSQYLTGSLGAPGVTAHTVFAVLAFPTPYANRAACAAVKSGGGVNSGFALFTEAVTGLIGRTGDGASFTTASSNAAPVGSLGVYSTAAKTGGSVDVWANGVSMASVSTALTLVACPTYYLFQLASSQYFFDGDAYEFIIYDSVLSTADRMRVHRYLGARYNVNVP